MNLNLDQGKNESGYDDMSAFSFPTVPILHTSTLSAPITKQECDSRTGKVPASE
jgi:hypothetical protein